MLRGTWSKACVSAVLAGGALLAVAQACTPKPDPSRARAETQAQPGNAMSLQLGGSQPAQTRPQWRHISPAALGVPGVAPTPTEPSLNADADAEPDAPAVDVDAVDAPAAPPVAADIEGAAEAIAQGDARKALALTQAALVEPLKETPARVLAVRGTALLEVGRFTDAVSLFAALRARKSWSNETVPEIVEYQSALALAGAADAQADRAQAQALRDEASGLLANAIKRKFNREGAAMRVARARVQSQMLGKDEKAEFWAAVRATKSLDAILRDYPNHPEFASLRLTRARTLVRAKKYSSAQEAYRTIAVEHAGQPEAELAWREWEALAQAKPKKVSAPKWTTRMKLDAAKHARNARFVKRSRAILDELLADETLGRTYRREAVRSSAQTARRQRDWDRCISDLQPEYERTHNLDARDELSRCFERGEKYDELLDLWLNGVAKKSRAQQEKAYFRGAEYAFRAGKYRRARELIEKYEKRWRGHASERNFMRAMIAEHLDETGTALDEFKRLGYRSESRKEMARYYRGKILLRSGDESQRLEGTEMLRKMVARGWESLTTSGIYGGFPLYYALQARQRLISAGVDVQAPPKLNPEREPDKVHEWAPTRARFDAAREQYGDVSEALNRADTLHKMGQVERARRELRVAIDELLAGVARAKGGKLRSPHSEALQQGLGWKATWSLPKPRISKRGRALIRDSEALRAYKLALRELAMALDEPYRVAKLGEYTMPYRTRYFRQAYAGPIGEAAKLRGVDATHLWSLMYTESRFRRHVVSAVGARGALQIMPWTGRQLLERLSEFDGHFNADTLFEIETNSRLAGYYVAELMDNFNGQPAFAYASYNGGPSNVARWLEAKGKAVVPNPVGLDDYIEEIPFRETHRYTRRVLETQAAYQWMYKGVLPAWSESVDPQVKHSIEF